MSDVAVNIEEMIGMARELSSLDKVRLVEEVMSLLEEDLAGQATGARRSLYGIWPDASVSIEDIDTVRQEVWGGFPRKDI